MHSMLALATPLALMLPWAVGEDAPALKAASAPQCEAAAQSQAPQVNPLSAMRVQLIARQVRIEQAWEGEGRCQQPTRQAPFSPYPRRCWLLGASVGWNDGGRDSRR